MKSTKQSRSRNAVDQSKLCQFSFADGRQCRMFRHESHASLCLVHAREEQQLLAQDEIGEELESISGEFRTTTDINHVIGKLFRLVANGRIPARRAENLTYLAQPPTPLRNPNPRMNKKMKKKRYKRLSPTSLSPLSECRKCAHLQFRPTRRTILVAAAPVEAGL